MFSIIINRSLQIMKIALIGHKGINGDGGGVEAHVRDLALSLAARGHAVTSYGASDKTGYFKEVRTIKVFTLPLKNLEAALRTLSASLLTIFKHFDLIHIHSIGPGSFIPLFRLFNPRTPIIFTFHCQDYYHEKWGWFARTYLRFGEWVACRLADQIIAIAPELVPYIQEKYGRDATYIANATGQKEYHPVKEICERWGLQKGSYILSVSRLVRHKGIHTLIEAYQGLATDKKLVIVGGSAYTDDYERELRVLAANHPNIIFTGAQSGDILAELYANAAVFVQPSRSEGLSIALLEAMSYSLPCVVSNITANVQAAGEAGVSFVAGDAVDLREKLASTLADQAGLDRLGSAAIERIAREYNLDTFIYKHEQLYS